jgi:hypothetical protein
MLAAKSRRRAPLLLGLLMAAVAAAGYLGCQHFVHDDNHDHFADHRPHNHDHQGRGRQRQ